MIHDDRLRILKAALAADPANLALAWRYWEVLGAWQGRDMRSGMHAIQVFREAALASLAGVQALAQAYRQLFEASGEKPRVLDPHLARCVKSALEALSEGDRAVVQWLLNCVGNRTAKRSTRFSLRHSS
jgi:hypothetical protein